MNLYKLASLFLKLANMSAEEAYSILGISSGASIDDIKSAYKAMALRSHPDRGGSEELMSKINQAYDLLKGPGDRSTIPYQDPSPARHGRRSKRTKEEVKDLDYYRLFVEQESIKDGPVQLYYFWCFDGTKFIKINPKGVDSGTHLFTNNKNFPVASKAICELVGVPSASIFVNSAEKNKMTLIRTMGEDIPYTADGIVKYTFIGNDPANDAALIGRMTLEYPDWPWPNSLVTK